MRKMLVLLLVSILCPTFAYAQEEQVKRWAFPVEVVQEASLQLSFDAIIQKSNFSYPVQVWLVIERDGQRVFSTTNFHLESSQDKIEFTFSDPGDYVARGRLIDLASGRHLDIEESFIVKNTNILSQGDKAEQQGIALLSLIIGLVSGFLIKWGTDSVSLSK